jgi:hypothetical protein
MTTCTKYMPKLEQEKRKKKKETWNMFQKTTMVYLTPNHHQFNLIFKNILCLKLFHKQKTL